MKKILAMLLAVLMVVSLAACGGSGNDAKTDDGTKGPGPGPSTGKPSTTDPVNKDITLTVWTADLDQGEGSWLENRLEAFKAAYPEYNWTFELGVCGEGDAGNTIKADPSAAGDVFMYANDQLGVLYEAGALAKLGGNYLEQVKKDDSALVTQTVTYTDGGVYGFPVTNNTWFLYYNKNTYTADDIKTMDGLLAKGTVAMQMGTAWYTAGFFMANGGTLFGENGMDAAAGIQFGGQKGYDAAKCMVDLAANDNFVDDVNGSAVAGMIEGSVDAMFSGSWDYNALHEGMGDKLGCASLPTITIAGQQVQLKSFAGSKAVGVNPHCDNQKEAMMLAAFLASEESQMKRFEMRAITPCHVNLAESDAVAASEVAVAEIAVMNNCSVIQPVIPELGSFWSPMGTFGGAVMNGDVTAQNYMDQVDLLNGQLNKEGL
ncbi:MAG: extracellular solute-binding protein [Oscillospiraceae bacterium]|nr:extracellular solute-binding protein [Oscillospiraceae bacterium]